MKSFLVKSLVLSLTVFSIGMLVTYFLSVKVKGELYQESYLKIANIAKQVSMQFQDALDISFNDLQALQAFYSVNKEHFSQHEFEQYMKIFNIDERHYIQALSWVPLVKHSEREQFERKIRQYQPNFTITERNQNAELITSKPKYYYTPVTYISPYKVNQSAQGFDLNSNSTRRHSLELARNSGKMTTTAKIRLVQEVGHSVGFLIIAPVYQQNVPIKNTVERIKALVGYVTGVFRINTLMIKAKEQADKEDLTLTLFDLDKENGGLLYGNMNNVNDNKSKAFTFELTIPDRRWQLNITINKKLLNSLTSPPIVNWLIAAGFLMSFLLALLTHALMLSVTRAKDIVDLSKELQDQNSRLEIKVQQRTQKLAETNNQLNNNINELTDQRIALSELIKELEAAKTVAEDRAINLARSNKDLDDFAYVASHDLKAPLRGIDQLAKWVAEDIEEEDFKDVPKHLNLMRSRVQRLEKLLNDLLDYSRVNRENNVLTTVDSSTLVRELFTLVAPHKGIVLTLNGDFPIFTTFCYPFEQVIRNLLNNAIKHHDKAEGNIQVECEDLGNYYQFSIKDDGPGIQAEYHIEIFKMFKTLKPRDEKEGSGMGLALIQKIVEYYEGEISITSTLGQGSTFYFTWPKVITQANSC